MWFRAFVALGLIFCATACAGPTATAPAADRIGTSGSFVDEYRLGVGDKVKVNVFNEASLSGEFALSSNGTVSLPLIGDVAAAGKTTKDVASEVQLRLADGYLRDPKVSIEVTAYRPFYILGEVKAPGTYPYVNGLTVLNAVATAEGFTPRADKHVVFIRPSGGEREAAYKLTPDLRIFPGDTIRLGERYF